MTEKTKPRNTRIEIVVADDRMQAWLMLPDLASPGFAPPDDKEVVAGLTEQKILINDSVKQRIQDYMQLLNSDQSGDGPAEIPQRYLIAKGDAPVDARHGQFEWAPEYAKQVQDWQGDMPINYYDANSVLTVDAGLEIGRIKSPEKSVVGRDVFGKEVEPRLHAGEPIKLDGGLRFSEEDPAVVVTEVAGRLQEQDQTLSMCEVLEVQGDVDFNSGNIDSLIDVHVRGDVKPKFQVSGAKSISIAGAVDAAELSAGEDIQVRGGLFGQESECIAKAGRNVAANICVDMRIVAGGDIAIGKEILNSNLHADGELLIEHGSVIGGEVYARNGVRVRHIGSELGVPTRIAVGIEGAVLYRSRQMEADIKQHQEQASRIQQRIKPLIQNMKRLTSTQREQATELMSKATDMEFVADDLEEQRALMVAKASPEKPAGIELAGVMHAGVVLVFGLREAVIKTAMKGPLRIEERKLKGVTEITMINPLTGSLIPLPSTPVDVELFKKQEQKAGETDGDEQS